MEICDDLTKAEVDQMKFIATAWVSRKQLEKVSDGIDLCVALEKGEVLNSTYVEPLVELIRSLERQDLIAKLEHYQGICSVPSIFHFPLTMLMLKSWS